METEHEWEVSDINPITKAIGGNAGNLVKGPRFMARGMQLVALSPGCLPLHFLDL